MTRDQWIAIFDKDQQHFPSSLSKALDSCGKVVYLHNQKDRLVEAVVQVQRSNIRKLIDQQELPLVNDFFKDSDRGLGSSGSN